jgi:hypothetical protein
MYNCPATDEITIHNRKPFINKPLADIEICEDEVDLAGYVNKPDYETGVWSKDSDNGKFDGGDASTAGPNTKITGITPSEFLGK